MAKFGLHYDRKDARQADARRDDPWQPVAALWDDALANPIHSPFCSCLVPGGLSIDGGTIEQDLIDYLRPRYQAEGLARLADVLSRRVEAQRLDFISWLREIGHNLPDIERQRLMVDLASTLSTFQEASPNAHFACG